MTACSDNIEKLKDLLKENCAILEEQKKLTECKLSKIQLLKRMKVLVKKLDIVLKQTKILKNNIKSKLK